MAIAEPTTSASPFAKFSELGQKLVGAYGGRLVRQQQNFDTKAPLFKADGKPQNEEVLYLIAMPGSTAVTGNLEAPTALTPGDEVRFAVSGFKWGQLIDGCKALPAAGPIKAGQRASGDVFEITLVGWSTGTDNPEGARKAGYTVEDGRIVIRSNEARDKFVLERVQRNLPANLGKDYTITVRRPTAGDAQWEKQADELFLAKPWENGGSQPTTQHADGDAYGPDDEPF